MKIFNIQYLTHSDLPQESWTSSFFFFTNLEETLDKLLQKRLDWPGLLMRVEEIEVK